MPACGATLFRRVHRGPGRVAKREHQHLAAKRIWKPALTTLMRTLLLMPLASPVDGEADSATPRLMKKQYSTPVHVTAPRALRSSMASGAPCLR